MVKPWSSRGQAMVKPWSSSQAHGLAHSQAQSQPHGQPHGQVQGKAHGQAHGLVTDKSGFLAQAACVRHVCLSAPCIVGGPFFSKLSQNFCPEPRITKYIYNMEDLKILQGLRVAQAAMTERWP